MTEPVHNRPLTPDEMADAIRLALGMATVVGGASRDAPLVALIGALRLTAGVAAAIVKRGHCRECVRLMLASLPERFDEILGPAEAAAPEPVPSLPH